MRRPSLILLCVLASGAALAGPAGAVGGAPGVSLGGEGVADSAAGVRYVALPAGARTVVAAIGTDTGRVLRFTKLRGSYGVAFTTLNGDTGGLTPDGGTLALQGRPGSTLLQATSRFVLLDTKKLRPAATFSLRGDFSFDALSPDGATLYLIQHVSAQDLTRYLVRAYDLQGRRLLPRVVADKSELNETMAGYPAARATSRDGAWVYTLYRHDGAEPFVHALDTVHRRAICIDLPWQGSQDRIWSVNLVLRESVGRLDLVDRSGRRIESIDLRSRRTQTVRAADRGGKVLALALGGGTSGFVLLSAGALLLRRRKRHQG